MENSFQYFAEDGRGYFTLDIRDARSLIESAEIQYMSIQEIFVEICVGKELNSGMLYS